MTPAEIFIMTTPIYSRAVQLNDFNNLNLKDATDKNVKWLKFTLILKKCRNLFLIRHFESVMAANFIYFCRDRNFMLLLYAQF